MCLCLLLLTTAWLGGPAVAGDVVEEDLRLVRWPQLRRLCLEAGVWPPVSLPVSRGEIAVLLAEVEERSGAAFDEASERRRLAAWRERYGAGGGAVGAGGRLVVSADRLGRVVPGEAGLVLPGGASIVADVSLDWRRDNAWAAVTPRLSARVFRGRRVAETVSYAGWPAMTAAAATGDARRLDDDGEMDWPRAVAGLRLGNWAVSAGLQPRRLAPGASGSLVLDDTAPSFAAVTLRRTAPFRWSGAIRKLAPQALLFRCGRLSGQSVRIEEEDGFHERRDRPWLMQWLVTWRHASWLRTTLTHSCLAVPREGSLWPDLAQVNFPGLASTWNETDRGPITDRIFSARLEGIFTDAPWPLLPAAAGRVYWEYGGEDIRPDHRLGFLPELAAPASVIGCELVSPAWDLEVEYAETEHPLVNWYTHSNFRGGYSHDGWLLGHRQGSAAETLSVEARRRSDRSDRQVAIGWNRRISGRRGWTPARATRHLLRAEFDKLDPGVGWSIFVQWGLEWLDPWDGGSSSERVDIWSVGCALSR